MIFLNKDIISQSKFQSFWKEWSWFWIYCPAQTLLVLMNWYYQRLVLTHLTSWKQTQLKRRYYVGPNYTFEWWRPILWVDDGFRSKPQSEQAVWSLSAWHGHYSKENQIHAHNSAHSLLGHKGSLPRLKLRIIEHCSKAFKFFLSWSNFFLVVLHTYVPSSCDNNFLKMKMTIRKCFAKYSNLAETAGTGVNNSF